MANNIGKITQIIGAVLDIKFTEGNLPEINDAIKVPTKDGKELVVEVSQHLGDDIVRCIDLPLRRRIRAVARGAEAQTAHRPHVPLPHGPLRRPHRHLLR